MEEKLKKVVKNRWLKISSAKFNIERALDYLDYPISLMISVDDISRPDQQQGEVQNGEKVMFVDVIYKAKPSGELIIKDGMDKVYIKSDRRSKSNIWRIALCSFNNKDIDDYTFYQNIMGGMIKHQEIIIPMILSKLKELD